MKKLLLYIFIALSTLPIAVRAADTYTLLEPLPCIEGTGTNCAEGETMTEISLNGYIGYVFKFSIALAAFLAVIMIIWGGFEYMLSETPFGKSSGKDRVTNALVGLLGILASYLILATIDPRLVEISTDIPKIEFKNSQSVVDFQRQLGEDMARLSTNAQLEYKQTQAQITTNTSKLEGFKNKEETVGLEPDEKVEYETLKLQTNELQASKIKILAIESMDTNFTTTFSLIQDSQKIAFETFGRIGRDGVLERRQEAMDTTLKYIEKTYATYSPQLIAAHDIEGERALLYRKNFYKDEMEQEKKFSDTIINYVAYSVGTEKQMRDMKTNLEREVAQAQDPLSQQDEASGFTKDQALRDLHINILQTRVEILNNVINKKK